jgi:hypothetical protein
MVRPWALFGPVVVLIIALPLLRPLRHPDPAAISDEETARLATVQAMVEHGTLAIDETDFKSTRLKVRRDGQYYSDQPPVMSALLAPSYWVMRRAGVDFESRPDLAIYLLTVLGVTLPVAASAGLIYRMGRLFELRRPWRMTLGLVAVLASGLVSYATVLNPHAPAAALVLCAAACLIHVSITNKRLHGSVWLILSGLCAALAATIDPPAIVFLLLMPAVVFGLRWTITQRVGGAAAYVLGAAVPLLLHASLSAGVEGHGFRMRGPAGNDSLFSFLNPDSRSIGPAYDEYEFDEEDPRGAWEHVQLGTRRLAAALLGTHGLLSHFPVVLLGVIGVSMVMHRHWPATTKVLASVSLAGALLLLILFALRRPDWHGSMFASRWFVVFVPLLVFWAGAWLRRPHSKVGWTAAAALLAFSLAASMLGATGPLPRHGFIAADGSHRYTVAGALQNLLDAPRPLPEQEPLAGG